jgi:hypothetical protein
MTDINPRIVDGEPVCSGEECPCCEKSHIDKDGTLRVFCNAGGTPGSGWTYLCIHGLRAQLDALQAERDEARRRYCEYRSIGRGIDAATIAIEEGWAYLYEVKV